MSAAVRILKSPLKSLPLPLLISNFKHPKQDLFSFCLLSTVLCINVMMEVFYFIIIISFFFIFTTAGFPNSADICQHGKPTQRGDVFLPGSRHFNYVELPSFLSAVRWSPGAVLGASRPSESCSHPACSSYQWVWLSAAWGCGSIQELLHHENERECWSCDQHISTRVADLIFRLQTPISSNLFPKRGDDVLFVSNTLNNAGKWASVVLGSQQHYLKWTC